LTLQRALEAVKKKLSEVRGKELGFWTVLLFAQKLPGHDISLSRGFVFGQVSGSLDVK